MNNKEIFGERLDLTYGEALKENLITKPYLHITEIVNYRDTRNFLSPRNYANVIRDSFLEHKKTLKNLDKCAPKLLVKCPSVDMMWEIKRELLEIIGDNINVFAGASRGDEGSIFGFEIGREQIKSKIDFLNIMQGIDNSAEAIILHYDILSEGIDVPGITGVMFLSKELPTKSKILQTIGRATRLHKEDRDNIFINRTVAKGDYEKMIKPNCAVILPIMSRDMGYSVEQIARLLIDLRDEFGINSEIEKKGDDASLGEIDNTLEGLNKLDKNRRSSVIDGIRHYIELYDNSKIIDMQNTEVIEVMKLKEKDPIEFIKQYTEILKKYM